MKKVTVNTLLQYKQQQEKFSCLTSYDASFAAMANEAGIDVLLVGDSLGNVIQGLDTTIPVTIEQMCYHTRCVAAGNSRALIVADMPFMAHMEKSTAIKSATALMQAGAHMIKMECGRWQSDIVTTLVRGGIPVCIHIGLTPQTVNTLGGFKVQGREEQKAEALIEDAIALEAAGAQLIVMECVPSALAKKIDDSVKIPTIGIGAGIETTGQVLVVYDMLGFNKHPAKFVRNFMLEAGSIQDAFAAYHNAVKSRTFPGSEHCFN